jgi:hypothetical protein
MPLLNSENEIRLPVSTIATSTGIDSNRLHHLCLLKMKGLRALGPVTRVRGLGKTEVIFELNETQALYLSEGKHTKRIKQAFSRAKHAKLYWLQTERYDDGRWEITGLVPEDAALALLAKLYP